jgi:hypothetical protein
MSKVLEYYRSKIWSDSAPTAQLEPYEYERLGDPNTIRLFKLYPGNKGGLAGELIITAIDKCPPYEALSYYWGDPSPYDVVAINGKALQINKSLTSALKRFRHHHKARTIWADQVSINQKDVNERNQQVQFMNSIYESAQGVLVWLGNDDTGQAAVAFGLINELDQRLPLEAKTTTSFCDVNLDDIRPERWQAFGSLLSRQWVSDGNICKSCACTDWV